MSIALRDTCCASSTNQYVISYDHNQLNSGSEGFSFKGTK
jgi:hypothetical protein